MFLSFISFLPECIWSDFWLLFVLCSAFCSALDDIPTCYFLQRLSIISLTRSCLSFTRCWEISWSKCLLLGPFPSRSSPVSLAVLHFPPLFCPSPRLHVGLPGWPRGGSNGSAGCNVVDNEQRYCDEPDILGMIVHSPAAYSLLPHTLLDASSDTRLRCVWKRSCLPDLVFAGLVIGVTAVLTDNERLSFPPRFLISCSFLAGPELGCERASLS